MQPSLEGDCRASTIMTTSCLQDGSDYASMVGRDENGGGLEKENEAEEPR